MPKSREFVESSDSEKESGATATSKKSKATDSSSKDHSSAKRMKTTDGAGDGVASKTGSSGERLYDLGKLRYLSVSDFKGRTYVNIREYYENKGVEQPGKKGICLSVDQWEKLKSFINQVDQDLKKSK